MSIQTEIESSMPGNVGPELAFLFQNLTAKSFFRIASLPARSYNNLFSFGH